jgi:hypothetical protein
MRSFRLYAPRPTYAVERQVGDYTVDERAKFWEEFQPAADRYRRNRRIAIFFNLVVILGWLCVIYLPLRLQGWWLAIPAIAIVGFISWAVFSGAFKLNCPACRNDLRFEFGPYCPQCGGRNMQPARWYKNANCPDCRRSLYQGKHRNCKIRACTHCGIILDEKGL